MDNNTWQEAIALGFLTYGKPLNLAGLLQEILVTFWDMGHVSQGGSVI